VELRDVGHAFDDSPLFRGGHFLLEAGSRLAIIGENGVGKSTLLRCLVGELAQSEGTIKWSENASIGYCAQDNSAEFDNDLTVFEWMSQWRTAKHDDLIVRGILGRLLFSADDVNKKAKSCSGGEKNRLMFGKLMMQDINVIVMDEPTNHMDMEAIESLNKGLEQFPGTLIFVSHDREFVSSLATDIIEIKDQQLIHFNGSYDEYLAHLEKVRAVA
jgi:ATPase components of ABC transporters with duplicated ATPase domains